MGQIDIFQISSNFAEIILSDNRLGKSDSPAPAPGPRGRNRILPKKGTRASGHGRKPNQPRGAIAKSGSLRRGQAALQAGACTPWARGFSTRWDATPNTWSITYVMEHSDWPNVASWLDYEVQPPEFDFRSSPNNGHSVARAGLPVLTQSSHSGKPAALSASRLR
jgi:hypothetical protein